MENRSPASVAGIPEPKPQRLSPSIEAKAWQTPSMSNRGRCVCGGVSYRVDGPLRDVINCHCDRCRRHTGHFMAATAADVADVSIQGETLRWYTVGSEVQYGFCGNCGSTMFWRAADKPESLSIAAGTLDHPTGLTTTAALFTEDAADYHELDETIRHYPKDL